MNKMSFALRHPTAWTALAAVLFGLASPAGAADKAADKTSESAEQRYQRERADCLAGRTTQSRDTCLQEAGAARAEGRRQGLTSPEADFTRNQRQRCEALPQADRQACIARMSGEGSTKGSVADGGVLRELTTRSTGPVPAAAGASAAASGVKR